MMWYHQNLKCFCIFVAGCRYQTVPKTSFFLDASFLDMMKRWRFGSNLRTLEVNGEILHIDLRRRTHCRPAARAFLDVQPNVSTVRPRFKKNEGEKSTRPKVNKQKQQQKKGWQRWLFFCLVVEFFQPKRWKPKCLNIGGRCHQMLLEIVNFC